MSLTTIFQLSVYGLAALSAAMLAFGEGAPFPALITVPLAALAYLVNERRGLFRIGALWTNLMGLVALGLVVSEFFGPRADARVLAGAHFLVYLTWIVMFQDKRFRQYWWLLALGMLQVAVGSVLTNSGWWGCLLFLYLLMAVWTMAIFHLYRGASVFGMLEPASLPDAAQAPAQRAALEASRGSADAAEKALAVLFRPAQRSKVRHAVQQDRPGRWVSLRFVCGIACISFLGLLLGLLVFLLVPRIEHNARQALVGRTGTAVSVRTGFSTQVRLGHLGRILESNERAMQVVLYQGTPDRRLRLEDFAAAYGLEEPLFRGSVLNKYDSGKWMGDDRPSLPMASYQTGRRNRTGLPESDRRSGAPSSRGIVIQEYRLFNPESPVLFVMRPVQKVVVEPPEPVSENPATGVVTVGDDIREMIKYQVFSARPFSADPGDVPTRPFADMTTRGDAKGMAAESPGGEQKNARVADGSVRAPLSDDPFLQLPGFGLERLKELAQKIANEEQGSFGPQVSQEMRQAQRIVAWLRDSGHFTYSLNMTVVNPVVDPVEDFLFNRHSGHCEYFASALALMLRAVDIPSRLVIGYKGAEPNSSVGNYDVMQRHAHAWVEAAIDGEWIVLDATPAERDESVRSRATNAGLWTSARDQLSSLWSNYVVTMSSTRQKEAFYDPLLTSFSGGFASARETFASWTSTALSFATGLNSQQFLSATGMLFLMALLAGVACVLLLTRAILRWLLVRMPGLAAMLPVWLRPFLAGKANPRFVVAFYERFIKLMSANGLEPTAGQTPREFALHVEIALAGALRAADLASLPQELTELYYRVRFGGQALAPLDSENLESRLRLMEQQLSRA